MAAAAFRARPLLLSSPMRVDRSLSRPVTSPAPFPLRGLELSLRAQELLRLKVEREREEERQLRAFHALPVPSSVYTAPARVGGANGSGDGGERRPLTTAEEVQLQSEVRAMQRARWEEQRRLQVEAEAEQQRHRVRVQCAEQRLQLRSWRRSLVHQPLPLPSFSPDDVFQPTKSDRALTAPNSPPLRTKRRAQLQLQADAAPQQPPSCSPSPDSAQASGAWEATLIDTESANGPADAAL